MFKSMRFVHPEFELWRDFHYEYEPEHRWPVDVINGGPALRLWVDDPKATMRDWEDALCPDERAWATERAPFLLYGADP